MPFLASEGCFWPLTASITLEVKNNHAYVTTQRILNKFIEINFLVGSMVWPWWCLFQHWLPAKILIRIPTVQFKNSFLYILTTFSLKCTNKIASNDYIFQKIKNIGTIVCNDKIERTSVCFWDYNVINIEKRRKLFKSSIL